MEGSESLWEEAFCGVRGWVKEILFFLNVSSKNQKSAHLPYQFRPQNESHFWGAVWGVWGASEGINSAGAVDPRGHSRVLTPQACAGRFGVVPKVGIASTQNARFTQKRAFCGHRTHGACKGGRRPPQGRYERGHA